MKRLQLVASVGLTVGITGMLTSLYAADAGLTQCLKAASAKKPGDYVKLEYLMFDGRPVYELEVEDAEGLEWEFMCDAETGKIFEEEQEADSEESPIFAQHKKITLKEAQKVVLAKYPGDIVEVEYEIEANGDPSYEIDVIVASGQEFKVEVDARTGKIIEESEELWEIGQEPDEMAPR